MGAKLVKCKSCGHDIAKSAIVCPSCGAKISKPIYGKKWFWVIIIIFILAIAGASGAANNKEKDKDKATASTASTESKETPKQEAKKEKFEFIGEFEPEQNEFAVYISGKLKNNSGKNISYCQITFNLYAEDNSQIGTALANINNLEKDGVWSFKAMGVPGGKKVASYKVAKVTGF